MKNKRSSIRALMKCDSPRNPQDRAAKHVVLVMDGMKEFTTESLEWILENVIEPGCIVTLLGAMPWLNIPLSFKVWLDVWPVKIENYSNSNQNEWNLGDAKYQKLQEVIDLCTRHGVVLQKKIVMGYPLKLLVVEKIIGLHPTLVVLDRNQKKDRRFYEKKVPCNMILMRADGEIDIIKRTGDDEEDAVVVPKSPACWFPNPKLFISVQAKKKQLKELKNSDDEPDKSLGLQHKL